MNTVKHLCRFLMAAIALAAVPAIGAPDQAAGDPADYPQVLQNMVDSGRLRVLEQFPTSKDGLTGYIVQRGGFRTVVYSADGYLLIGPLYGPEGRNLSKKYARKYAPTPNIEHIIQSLDAAHFVTQGPADAPTLYVFADPNCIFCHKLYKLTQPLIEAGRLRVQWIMVGVLGRSSIVRAAAILAAADPAAALARIETRFAAQHEQGGAVPDPGLRQVLKAHRQAMFALGSTSTPTVVFRAPDGSWHAREGLPPDGWLEHYAQD